MKKEYKNPTSEDGHSLYHLRLSNVQKYDSSVFQSPYKQLAIYIVKLHSGANQWTQFYPDRVSQENSQANFDESEQLLYFRQFPLLPDDILKKMATGFEISDIRASMRDLDGFQRSYSPISKAWPHSSWSPRKCVVDIKPEVEYTAAAVWYAAGSITRTVCLSYDRPAGKTCIAIVDNVDLDAHESDIQQPIATSLYNLYQPSTDVYTRSGSQSFGGITWRVIGEIRPRRLQDGVVILDVIAKEERDRNR
jgi:hypothetical protein